MPGTGSWHLGESPPIDAPSPTAAAIPVDSFALAVSTVASLARPGSEEGRAWGWACCSGPAGDMSTLVGVPQPSLVEIARQMDDLLSEVRAYARDPGIAVRIGSPCSATAELMSAQTGPGGQWVGGDAHLAAQMGWLLLEAAGRYLAGCACLLRSEWPMFAMPPVVRSLFEAVGRAAWLLDPSVGDVRMRAARVRLLWLDELRRAADLSASLGAKADATPFRRARYDYETAIAQDFYPAEVRLNNPDRAQHGFLPMLCEQSLPGMRASVKYSEVVYGQRWGATGFYDFLSTASHPNLLPTLHNVLAPGGEASVDGAATVIAENLIDVDYLSTLASNSISAYLDTWLLVARYHGVDTSAWVERRRFYLRPYPDES